MRTSAVAALCVALLACAATVAVAQPKAAPAAKANTFVDETPRGPPLARPPPLVKEPPPAAPPAGGATPPPGVPATPTPPEALCECPLPESGFFGRGKDLMDDGCACKNACEFTPTPSGGKKPSCATLCDCPFGVKVQTFSVKRGPLVREYPFGHKRRLVWTADA